MNNKVQEGDAIQITAGATIASGDVVPLGAAWGAMPAVGDKPGRISVAITDIANGANGSVALKGVYRLAATTAEFAAMAVGDTVFWNNSTKKISSTQASNYPAGMIVGKPSTDVVDVKIG